eukprot:TRINITY_DN528_c0_g1_i1.p1 TRINITY_DN528_c0_g1~~TRINITY_DN528_c0_g1_i1.p1  ORF type:complete len:130 (-),score=26.16 TRINITY_DN528_c0_g1_i1:126-515(-)
MMNRLIALRPTSSQISKRQTTSYRPIQSKRYASNFAKLRTMQVSAAVLAMTIPGYFILGSSIVDAALLVTVPVHLGIGLKSVIQDYVPKPLIPLGVAAVFIAVLVVFLGLLKMMMDGSGLTSVLGALWA